MICSHPECTGSHDLRKRADLCPRTRQDERESSERWKRANLAKYMLSQIHHEAHRRGQRATAQSD